MKTAFCTYCSAAKDEEPNSMPAIDRYFSQRIAKVSDAASQVGSDFLIFSGKFGLLKPADLIPFYDHLLVDEEVADMVPRVADQLKTIMADTGLQALLFFAHSLEDDPLLGPYLRCLQEAGLMVKCSVAVVSLPSSITD